jgi:hypothetical protein
MPYWEMVTRSFKISWRHKYLWLLAFFSGETGSSFNFSQGNTRTFNSKNGQAPDFAAIAQPYVDWWNSHIGLIVALALLLVVLWVAFFILAAVSEGAVVRASAEHDAERPFGLGIAWRCGRATMGSIIRVRLLVFVLALPVAILLGAAVFGLVFTLLGKNYGAASGFGLLAGLVFLASIPYLIYLFFLDRLGTRAVVLEQVSAARAALGRAHGLVRKRLGRLLLVGLVGIATGIVVGICLAIALAIVILPLIIAGVATYASGGAGGAFLLVIAIGVVIVLPIVLAVSGFLAAQTSTYWTLAFRRLEIEQAPTYAYPYGYPPQYPQVTPPPAAPSA